MENTWKIVSKNSHLHGTISIWGQNPINVNFSEAKFHTKTTKITRNSLAGYSQELPLQTRYTCDTLWNS